MLYSVSSSAPCGGEVANEYLSKGSSVFIEGRLRCDAWEDNEGQREVLSGRNCLWQEPMSPDASTDST